MRPNIRQISDWHNYVSKNFVYRINWGLGSIVSLASNEGNDGEFRVLSLEDWPNTGLPWIVFWLKELITWGTLEPVVAYILAKGLAVTRPEAEALATIYYENCAEGDPNELLNPSLIRNWAGFPLASSTKPDNWKTINLKSRDFTLYPDKKEIRYERYL